jgi:hypothetical protein
MNTELAADLAGAHRGGAARIIMNERIETAETHWAKIYLSGPIEVAKQILREECMREGLCVTIEPTTFIYTGGEESGYVVGLVNYPKFPSTSEGVTDRAASIARMLRDRTFQHSCMIVTPSKTWWASTRETDR